MFPAWTSVIREMAAAGVGVRTQPQVLRMDTDRPGNGQCAGPLRQKGGTLVDPGPKQPENSSWKALGCFSEGTVHLVVPCLRFIIRISWWHFFFFYIKDGHTFGNAQNVRACQSIFRLGVYMHLGALEGRGAQLRRTQRLILRFGMQIQIQWAAERWLF